MAFSERPERGRRSLRILAWVVAGIALGLVLCCGGLFLAGTVSPSVYR